MTMKLLGSESPQYENPVGYNSHTHPNEPDFPQFHKPQTWATGDDAIINNQDKWSYNAPMNSTIPGGISMQPNNGKPPHQMLGHNQHPSHLQNHLNPPNHLNQTVLNHTLNQSGVPYIYDPHQSVNVNGVGVKPNGQFLCVNGQQLSVMPSQYMSRNEASVAISTSQATESHKNTKRSRSVLHQDLDKAISKALSHSVGTEKPQTKASLQKLIKQEMRLMEAGGGRGRYLSKAYEYLLSIKPTSVESERIFSSAGYLCPKIRCRMSDHTLDNLSFLRTYFQTKKE